MALNGAGRCPCQNDPNPCLSCNAGEGTGGPGSTMGVRPSVVNTRYVEDPLRDPAARYLRGGYMRHGYDTGRLK